MTGEVNIHEDNRQSHLRTRSASSGEGPLPKTPIEADRNHETARARADLLRRAEAQGVKPFTSLEDFAGDPEMTADFDVDASLRQVREDRNRPSNQNVE